MMPIYVYGYRQNWGEVGKERMFESALIYWSMNRQPSCSARKTEKSAIGA